MREYLYAIARKLKKEKAASKAQKDNKKKTLRQTLKFAARGQGSSRGRGRPTKVVAPENEEQKSQRKTSQPKIEAKLHKDKGNTKGRKVTTSSNFEDGCSK